jgi:hypothetical protein
MKWLVFFFPVFLIACKDKYNEGYQTGFNEGVIATEQRLKNEYEEKIKKIENSNRELSVTSTSVCGGGGVNVGGKHYEGGKTGCVKVYSDGRIVRY